VKGWQRRNLSSEEDSRILIALVSTGQPSHVLPVYDLRLRHAAFGWHLEEAGTHRVFRTSKSGTTFAFPSAPRFKLIETRVGNSEVVLIFCDAQSW
jgi:hypothetical protein